LLVLALTACSTVDSGDPEALAAPSHLTATLVDSNDNYLRWRNNATQAAGYWIEFSTPGDDFIKLDAVWPDSNSFRHRNVAKDTQFIYRVRPFFGRASDWVRIATGPAPREGTRVREVEGPLSPSGTETNSRPSRSLRSTLTIAEAAPASLSAGLSSATNVDLRWEDRAKDEDGYLVEMKTDLNEVPMIFALLPPDSTSFKKTHLPPGTGCDFRVRAFFYGSPSNLASASIPGR
jgi:hypothetical protein